MGRTAVRLGTAVIVALGALALVGVTPARAYPITGVNVQVTCGVNGSTAHCVATATARDSNGNPVAGADVSFSATYSGNSGTAPGGACGGMNPCSAKTNSSGQATSAVDASLCGGRISVRATITNPGDGSRKTAEGQSTLPPCSGTLASTGGSLGLPATSMLPPGDDHRRGEVILAGGILLGLGGAAVLAGRRRRTA
jgi:hypothetical protein